MRNNGIFYRTDEVSRENAKQAHSDWLEMFAEYYALKEAVVKPEKNAVEVSRQRSKSQSIFDMMNAIIGGGTSKNSSVEDVVKDYQNRTGLAGHINRKRATNLNAMANLIISSSENDELDSELENENSIDLKDVKPMTLDELLGDIPEETKDNEYEDYLG